MEGLMAVEMVAEAMAEATAEATVTMMTTNGRSGDLTKRIKESLLRKFDIPKNFESVSA